MLGELFEVIASALFAGPEDSPRSTLGRWVLITLAVLFWLAVAAILVTTVA